MLVEVKSIVALRADGQRSTRRMSIFECDTCHVQFERPYKKSVAERPKHFCSVKCVNACMGEVVEAGLQRRHGVANAWQIPGVVDKVRETVRARYGVDYPMQSGTIKRRRRENCLAKHGVDNVAKTPSSRAKMAQSNATRDWPTIVAQTKETLEKRYGECVSSAFQLSHIVARQKSPEAWAKRIATMRRNGTFNRSNPEDVAYQRLKAVFGEDNVKRQECLPGTRWPIDLHVLEPDVWIQVDGAYWHGLDVSQDTLMTYETSSNKRQRTIFSNFQRDRKQDDYATQQGLTLLRITDRQLKQDPEVILREVLKVDMT